MGRRPVAFKKTDVTRAIKGVIAAGVDVGRFEISRDGTLAIIPRNANQSIGSAEDLDRELQEFESRHD